MNRKTNKVALRRPAKTSAKHCPVAKLAHEFERLVRVHNALDRSSNEDILKEKNQALIWFRMDAIKLAASYVPPTSGTGAAFQIMIADSDADDLISSGISEYQIEKLTARIKRLNFHVTTYFRRDVPVIFKAFDFLMGAHLDPNEKLAELMRLAPLHPAMSQE